MASLNVGLSGFDYADWKGEGLFYPGDLPKSKFLAYYASRFNSLELNGTFKQEPSEASVARWNAATPEGFKFSPKMHQQITHFKRLKPESLELVNLIVERLEPLEKAGKLGPLFLQLPPNFKRDDDRLAEFLAAIPHRPSLRWAIEFRNESWNVPEIESLLRKYNVGWVAAETDEEPAQIRDTSDFLFVRLRKLEYTDDELKKWAGFFTTKVKEGRDCFVYCRHLDTVAPWKWADKLMEEGVKGKG